MNDTQIKHMVDRFLGWTLPENFSPDGGITFKPTYNEHSPFGPSKHEPVGTNLLDAQQAEAMVRHMIEGLPSATHSDGKCDHCEADLPRNECALTHGICAATKPRNHANCAGAAKSLAGETGETG